MLKEIVYKNVFIAALVVNLLIALLPLGLKGFLPPIVPILYGRPYGESQLVPVLFLSLVPIVSLAIGIANFVIASRVKDVFIKKSLAISTLFVSILAAIAVLKVILLVGLFN